MAKCTGEVACVELIWGVTENVVVELMSQRQELHDPHFQMPLTPQI